MKIGDRVRIKRFFERPDHWNAFGEMDKYMGRLVTVAQFKGGDWLNISEDSRKWNWKLSDFQSTVMSTKIIPNVSLPKELFEI